MEEKKLTTLERAVNQAVSDNPHVTDSLEGLIQKSYEHFIKMKLDEFPEMCRIARMQNKLKLDQLTNYGNKGKYTDSYGWSQDGTFKWEFDIPEELYLFMQCLVYKNFWSKENERIKRAFMNAICRGDDPMETLMKVKAIYGSNKDLSLID